MYVCQLHSTCPRERERERESAATSEVARPSAIAIEEEGARARQPTGQATEEGIRSTDNNKESSMTRTEVGAGGRGRESEGERRQPKCERQRMRGERHSSWNPM